MRMGKLLGLAADEAPILAVIASEAKQSIAVRKSGLLRRFAPHNDGKAGAQ
jgi:hypothetical protein